MRVIRTSALLLALATLPCAAETRTWKNADSSSSFVGDYLSQDGRHVTIRRKDGRIFTLEIANLHDDDRTWLKRQAPAVNDDADAAINPNAVFDTLCFGDNRKEVEQKLKDSSMVETALDETFFGRFGLNGTFRTKQQIGGLHCELYFDWTDNGGLSEISLQTESLGPDAYGGKQGWSYGVIDGGHRALKRFGYGWYELFTFYCPTYHGTFKPPYERCGTDWRIEMNPQQGLSEFPPELGAECYHRYTRVQKY